MKQKYWRFKNLEIDRGVHLKGGAYAITFFHYLDSNKELTADEVVEELKDIICFDCNDGESNEEIIRDMFNYGDIEQVQNVLLMLEDAHQDGVAWSYEELQELDDYLEWGIDKDFYKDDEDDDDDYEDDDE